MTGLNLALLTPSDEDDFDRIKKHTHNEDDDDDDDDSEDGDDELCDHISRKREKLVVVSIP